MRKRYPHRTLELKSQLSVLNSHGDVLSSYRTEVRYIEHDYWPRGEEK